MQNLQDSLGDELPEFSRSLGLTESELCDKLRRHYDGYHFAPDTAGVYNPFSLLHAFKNREFGSYWFATTITMQDIVLKNRLLQNMFQKRVTA